MSAYAALLDVAREVALEAAELVRTRRREGIHVTATKSSPIDIVTQVDQAAEELIQRRLAEVRPGDGFLGEEGGAAESATGVTWVVDPIDGTVNFLYGIPRYSVSIAASLDAEVVAGVVIDVPHGECFTATLGGGAHLDGVPIHVRPTVPIPERLVITGFNYRREVRARQAAAAAVLLPQVRDIRRLGSAALDLCAIGAGRADGYVEEGLFPWDRAAAGLVATEAGAGIWLGTGTGGSDCVVCAPMDGFSDFLALVESCGFLA